MTRASFRHPLSPFRRRHLSLLRQVASIQHRLLDQSTGLGYLWSFLNPLLMLLVLWSFFSRHVGADVPHYAIHLLIGLVLFTHVSKSASSAMRVLHRMRHTATNVIFPKDILVYSAVLANLPEFVISMALTVVIAALGGAPVSWVLLALPVVMAIQLVFVLWVSLLLSVTYVFVRDLDHLFEVGMRLLFFVTPIIYTVDMLSPTLRSVVLLNPLAHLMGFARTIVLEGRLPPGAALVGVLAVHVSLAYGALLIFRRAEPALLERL
jgi:ABC-type polysaccharide/polyol phosphate export permease